MRLSARTALPCVLNKYSFFDEVQRIGAPEYIPTEADVLRARTKTTGIYETRFSMGQLSIQYAMLCLLLLPQANLVANCPNLVCLTLAANAVSGKNGSTALRMSHRSYFVWR